VHAFCRRLPPSDWGWPPCDPPLLPSYETNLPHQNRPHHCDSMGFIVLAISDKARGGGEIRTREAAGRAGSSAGWRREVERDGRIGPFPRDVNGHRRLTDEDVERIRAVVTNPQTRSHVAGALRVR